MLSMLRAHGLDAGPTQRPLLTGFLTSLPADVPAIATLHAFGTLGALADAANISAASAILVVVACMALGGLLAICDRRYRQPLAPAPLIASSMPTADSSAR